ncbi:LpxL/LpxP family Kdo(2)-lipid IV(A) lauroyl/palmitoleoyl acyltransferase [Marinimicrobium alkaliphilum]|uniref:LpxL/LpxP family Kdo(2)-lipid IV(A) lauroyl/palmitoleoyl acyltransferase n=1 Tax=Marinimicrobium alkaliphilum TaxID=2202654 RepID=UPI000DB99C1E|nr:LpxL/LpxP family Kdo(2)-lipid IV(A) lauroyl/palmitoleoyl acyltransferase [Marinimicrobium alkaliphilum]
MTKYPYAQFRFAYLAPKYWGTWLLIGLFNVLGRLPVPVSLALGRALGKLLYRVAGSRRRIAQVNFALCFPEKSPEERERLVKRLMENIGMSFMETAISLWRGANRSLPHYTITGTEHVERAQAEGRGILLVGGHYTTLDVAGRMLAQHVKFDMIYRDQPNKLFFQRVLERRERFAGISIDRKDTRTMIRRLRQGYAVWYAPDQDYGPSHSVFAPFFGIQASTITGATRLATMGKAVVIPLFHYRDDNNHYHIELGAPLENFPSGDDVDDAAQINRVVEANIRRCPEQYLWVHRRFKTRPEGEPSLYPPRKRK